MSKKQIVAWIEIWHLPGEVMFKTIKEVTDDAASAKEQFDTLHKMISKFTKDSDAIILYTTMGPIRFSSKILNSSVLRLRIEEEDVPEEEVDQEEVKS
jgi:hypothetical protein